jgi:hypothetical protein
MLELIILGVSIPLLIFLLLRKRYLNKIVLTTEISHLEKNNIYIFHYVHGLFFKNSFTLTIKDDDEKIYVMKETNFYSGRRQVTISVFNNGVVFYTADLKNVARMEYYNIENAL